MKLLFRYLCNNEDLELFCKRFVLIPEVTTPSPKRCLSFISFSNPHSVVRIDEVQRCELPAMAKATEQLFDQRQWSLGCCASLVAGMAVDTGVFWKLCGGLRLENVDEIGIFGGHCDGGFVSKQRSHLSPSKRVYPHRSHD